MIFGQVFEGNCRNLVGFLSRHFLGLTVNSWYPERDSNPVLAESNYESLPVYQPAKFDKAQCKCTRT
jgi:hypothetical protein